MQEMNSSRKRVARNVNLVTDVGKAKFKIGVFSTENALIYIFDTETYK